MEILLTALGILLGTLMNIPARTVAAKESQRAKLAKTLYGLYVDIVKCVSTGRRIAAALREFLEPGQDPESRSARREALLQLVRIQTQQLGDLGKSATDGLIWSCALWNIPSPAGGALLQEEDFFDAKIERVLDVYHPGLSQHISAVVEPKRNHLLQLAKLLENTLEQENESGLKLSVIRAFASSERRSGGLYSSPEYEEIDLSDPGERARYMSSIDQRLSELEAGAERLRTLIEAHYEPHHLA